MIRFENFYILYKIKYYIFFDITCIYIYMIYLYYIYYYILYILYIILYITYII